MTSPVKTGTMRVRSDPLKIFEVDRNKYDI
jgi:hypothetical protein